MKKTSLLILCAFFLSACLPGGNPQATVTPEAAVTLTPTLTPAPTPTPTETPIPAVETVAEGSFWAKAGVPVGLEVNLRDGGFYAVNPVTGREVMVGSMDADGKPVPAEFLKYSLVPYDSKDEGFDKDKFINEILANRLPKEFAFQGGANRIAMLNDNEEFPDNVLLGQPIEKMEWIIVDYGTKYSILRWKKEAQQIFDADPEKMPHRIVGFFTIDTEDTETNGVTYIGIVHNWKNPDGTERYVTTTLGVRGFNHYVDLDLIDQLVFAEGWYKLPEGYIFKNPFFKEVALNPENDKILEEWLESQAVPAGAEDLVFFQGSPELNHH